VSAATRTPAVVRREQVMAPQTTRTLGPAGALRRAGECPYCGTRTEVRAGSDVTVASGCAHVRRAWRVTAGDRIRVEYRQVPAAAASAPVHNVAGTGMDLSEGGTR
jgi:hypothetical protein